MPLINLTLSPVTGITNKIVVLAKEASTPSVVVTYQEFNAPHTNPRNVSLLVDNPVPHIVEIYESDAGYPSLDTLLGSYTNDTGKVLTATTHVIYMEVDGPQLNDPVSGFNYVTHPDLVGVTEAIVFRRDSGEPLHPDEYTFDPVLGKITITDSLDIIQPHERIAVFTSTQIETAPTVTTLDLFYDIATITEDVTLDNTSNKVLHHCISDTTTLTITLDPVASFANKTLLGFKTSYGDADKPGTGNQKQMSIVFDDPTDFIDNESAVYLGQCEFVALLKIGGKWHVVMPEWGKDRVGELAYSDVKLLNTLVEDGELYERAEYPRLWNYISSLPGSQVISDVAWEADTNKQGLFSSGDGAGTFRMPLGYDKFRAAIKDDTGTDTTRTPSLPGGLQAQSTEDLYTKFDPLAGSQDFYMKHIDTPSWEASRYAYDNSGDNQVASTSNRNFGLEIGGLGTGKTNPINLGYLPLRRI